MALDTREKRANVLGVGRPWLRHPHPGTIDEQWRIARGSAYGGNALSPPSPPAEEDEEESGMNYVHNYVDEYIDSAILDFRQD